MVKKKIDAKEVGLMVLLGSGVIILTPILAGVVKDIALFSWEIIPGVISIGTALAAGVSALLMDLGITAWLRK